MQLIFSRTSPYVRKIMVLAHETGVIGQFEIVESGDLSAVTINETVAASNPIGKIPALVLDDGSSMIDSRVICEYLDGLHEGPKMFPSTGESRWRVLIRHAVADGILDAAVNTRDEIMLRPEQFRWPAWIDGQMLKVRRALDQLESEVEEFGSKLDMGSIAVACAVGYLDFRYKDEGWRSSRSKLAEWYEAFASRPSMQATLPE